MDVTISQESGATVARLSGRLDFLSAHAVKEQLVRAVTPFGILVVELGDVESMDSSGLAAVIGALKAARQGGGDLRIARPSTQVLTILELTTLDRVLVPYGTLEEAIQAGE